MKRNKFRVAIAVVGLAGLAALSLGATSEASATTPATLADLWAGTAHFELEMNRHMDGQSASGSSIVAVGSNWYWFHRKIETNGTISTVAEKSTDQGVSWTSPTTVLSATAGTPWASIVTDGSFYYDAANNKWIALMQTNSGTGNWTMSYFERSGSDPLGPFSVPSGFTEPAVNPGEIWNQVATTAGRDVVDIPGSTYAVYDEGTPQIIPNPSGGYYVTFHGASGSSVIHGYRGIATTTDFQNYTYAASDAIVDERDQSTWGVNWLPGGTVGVGAATILNQGGYNYQIIEGADTDLRARPGQNWPMQLGRSASITSTSWSFQSSPLLPPTGQMIEWQYPNLFQGSDGSVYLGVSLYGPDTESGFRIYKLVAGAATGDLGVRNSVVNSSFETTDHWSGSAFSFSTAMSHSGTQSIKSTVSGFAEISDPIPVEPNTTYRLSGWVYRTGSTGATYLDMNDIVGEEQTSSTSVTGSWQYLSGSWNSGAYSSVQVRAVTDAGFNSTAYFDDISLVKTGSTNIIDNESFDGGDAWALWGGGSLSTAYARTGTTSFKVVGTGTATAPFGQYLAPNTNYVVSVWIYKPSTAGRAYVDMNDISGEAQVGIADGTSTTGWTQVSTTWNSGSNVSVPIRVVQDGTSTSTAYFDDVSIKKQ